MANLPPDLNSGPGTPRWVKALGIIGIVLALLFFIMMLVGGNHGPNRHMPSGSAPASGETLPAGVVADGVRQP